MTLIPQGPHGPGLPGDYRLMLALGGLAALGGAIVLAAGIDRWGGMLISGFGVMLLSWGGLMSERITSPAINRLLLAVGLLSGVVAFGSAVMLLR